MEPRDTFRNFPMIRRLRNALLLLAALFVVGLGALVVLANVYETEVKVKLVGALNQQLNAPVAVSDMDLTLVARFPQASMRLNDVLAMEVRSDEVPPDTLLFAEALHLEFSLWDLFSGVYTVNEIHAEEVRLYPALDGNGQENYLVWKTDSTAAASPSGRCRSVSSSAYDCAARRARASATLATVSTCQPASSNARRSRRA